MTPLERKQIVDSSIDALQPLLHGCTVAIVIHHDWRPIDQGTGVLISLDGRLVVITAGHLVEGYQERLGEIHVAVTAALSDRPVSPQRIRVFGGRNEDRDLAVLWFSEKTEKFIGNYKSPVTIDQLDLDPSTFAGDGALIYGYPEALATELGIQAYRLDAILMATVFEDELPVDDSRRFKMLIGVSYDGEDPEVPHPRALSGSGIWRVRLAVSGIWTPRTAISLTGILTEHVAERSEVLGYALSVAKWDLYEVFDEVRARVSR